MRTPAASAAVAILVGLVSGCTTSAAPSPAAAPTPTTAATDAQPPVVEDQVQDYPELDAQPWEETSQDALDTAAAAVRVYLNPASPTWMTDLSAFLSPSALSVYGTVDPAVVPTGEVTGTPTVTQEQAGVLVTVRVPTSIGDLDVLMTRGTVESGGWDVEEITPVDSP
jgi:hypothetical protein